MTTVPANGQIVGNTPPEASISLTVNPDTSMEIRLDMKLQLPQVSDPTTPLPSVTVHSETSLTAQSDSVVETTRAEVGLPQEFAFLIQSITGSESTNDLVTRGNLGIDMLPLSPVDNIALEYENDLMHFEVNASARLFFSQAIIPKEAFDAQWTATFGNQTWISMVIDQVETESRGNLTISLLKGEIITETGMYVDLRLMVEVRPKTPGDDFISVFTQLASSMFPYGNLLGELEEIIRSSMGLVTGSFSTITYASGDPFLVLQSTTTYVANLDEEFNRLKSQLIALAASILPPDQIPPELQFIDDTFVRVSRLQLITDSSPSVVSTSLRGLVIEPPVEGTETDFTVSGFFQTLGEAPAPGVDFTLVGSSNQTHVVKLAIPSEAPAPDEATDTSAKWVKLRNFESLTQTRFRVERVGYLEKFTAGGVSYDLLIRTSSIVSGFAWDENAKKISFAAEGSSGTTGSANVTIPKTLVSSASSIAVFVDGTQINAPNVRQDSTSVYVYFEYSHSTRKIEIFLVGIAQVPASPAQFPWVWVAVAGTVVGVGVVLAVYLTKRRGKAPLAVPEAIQAPAPASPDPTPTV